ncbi:MAG: Gfo/Idh/MocA family oxidoreductase [Actinobacteria bacterium]|nr:Gfo/Idh/MocA family oxidoreductase [Actinomycetota bacterium]
MSSTVRIGVIGGGLMGRELVALSGRWMHLVDHPAQPRVTAIADPNPAAREWFETNAGVTLSTPNWQDLIASDDVDVLYIAVPHNLHEEIYIAAAHAGRDFLGEKPFGIDLASAERIVAAIDASPGFVRVSSELPFFPGAQRAFAACGDLGELIEVRAAFHHSSDMDRNKPINWKRRAEICGEIGVMGDLGMHVAHVPLRLGYVPTQVFAVLDSIVTERPASAGSSDMVPCDTWDNAMLLLRAQETTHPDRMFPMVWETRRISPGNTNSWVFEALGMDAGVRFTTRNPTVFHRFLRRGSEQVWEEVQPGNVSAWPMISPAIFEFGFSDALLQMWASYLAERAGALGDRFGCATPDEALMSHRVFAAALESQKLSAAVSL